ncbi:hypothetical protein pkur_cds_167 [Pandoravirus kuranda]|uniref:Protein kinase domain-containing protein n=1 Tax=Pandoravirus kuranda TaxID=3019033 RepID=A0AA95EDW0_9VIRU|nr:hypothetical protein pkur_cds_167 [Pandoravirus kuranda]
MAAAQREGHVGVLVSTPGDGHAALLRAAIHRAFRRCIVVRDDDDDPIERVDPSRPACVPSDGGIDDPLDKGAHSKAATANTRRDRSNIALARWVCFPFSERAYGSDDRDARAPALAAAFIDERRWQRVARRRLARASAFGWRAALAVGAAVVRRLPLDAETDVCADRPFALAPGLRLVACLCASRSASVFCARVNVSTNALDLLHRRHQLSSTTATCRCQQQQRQHSGDSAACSQCQDAMTDGEAIEIECVVKVINVRLSGDFERGWAGTRRSIGRGDHLVCAPAWSEPVALSRAYPTHFYGAGLFFCAADGDWYVCVAMPRYRSTLWTFTTGLAPANASGTHGTAWADTLLAALAQVVLHALPRARRNRLASHNDLKIDNVAYRRTSREYIYVRVATADDRGSTLLAIPTHGRLFYLIDFGWSSVSVDGRAHRPVRVESAACAVAGGATMRAWNAGTDTAQLGYSLMSAVRNRLGCARSASFYAHADRVWWPLADALAALMAVGDAPQTGPPAVLPLVGGRVADQRPTRDDAKRPHSRRCTANYDGGARNNADNASVAYDGRDGINAAHDDESSPDSSAEESSGSVWDDLFYAGISRACHLGRTDAFLAVVVGRFDATRSGAPLPRAGRIINTYALNKTMTH